MNAKLGRLLMNQGFASLGELILDCLRHQRAPSVKRRPQSYSLRQPVRATFPPRGMTKARTPTCFIILGSWKLKLRRFSLPRSISKI